MNLVIAAILVYLYLGVLFLTFNSEILYERSTDRVSYAFALLLWPVFLAAIIGVEIEYYNEQKRGKEPTHDPR